MFRIAVIKWLASRDPNKKMQLQVWKNVVTNFHKTNMALKADSKQTKIKVGRHKGEYMYVMKMSKT